MTKQWGHGFHTGQNKARLSARDAAEQLRSPELRAFELLHYMMRDHPDKASVNELHSAMLRAPCAQQYSHAAWLMMDTGAFEDHRPKSQEVLSLLKKLGDALHSERSNAQDQPRAQAEGRSESAGT
jgi:hypothetical protein